VNSHPLSGGGFALIYYRTKGRCKPATQTDSRSEIQRLRQAQKIRIGVMNRHKLRERSPVCETRLKLIIANLLIPRCALRAGATAAYERHRHAIAAFPLSHVFANRRDNSGQFMTGHVWKLNIRVVSDPAVPVAATNTSSHNLDYNAVRFRIWIRDIL
jgi:hypothetical protein